MTLCMVNNQNIESYPPVAASWRPPTAREPSQLKITSVGFVSWSRPNNADRYHANWRLKDGNWSSKIEVDAADPLNFTISGFDDTLEYEVRMKTEVDVGGTPVESGCSTRTWPMPVMENWHSGQSSDVRASDDDEWNWRIAPHNGASLIVWFRDGLLEARSGEQAPDSSPARAAPPSPDTWSSRVQSSRSGVRPAINIWSWRSTRNIRKTAGAISCTSTSRCRIAIAPANIWPPGSRRSGCGSAASDRLRQGRQGATNTPSSVTVGVISPSLAPLSLPEKTAGVYTVVPGR